MHPEMLRYQARIRIADDLTWAERERRALLARRGPSPDAVLSDPPIEHLSFTARVRTLLDVLQPVTSFGARAGRASA
jgi:hypothetical protein